MLDARLLREQTDTVKTALSRRSPETAALVDTFLDADRRWRDLLQEAETLKAERNQQSKTKPTPDQIAALKTLSTRIKELDGQITEREETARDLQLRIPNLPLPEVPTGAGSEDNVVLRTWGTPATMDFPAKEHDQLGTDLGVLDFDAGAKLSRARFVVYKGAGARLERALINFMLDVHTQDHGYTEILPPFLVNSRTMTGTGQLPKFADDLFVCREDDLWLIPTAEVPLTNIHSQEILAADQLPIYYTAFTPCFRREAGSYGKDTKGIIRQHQFNKVELVKFTRPEDSALELERLTNDAESILQKLHLPYRVMALCTGDLGFSSAKTLDLEVWFPSQNCYREISSCSNFVDFQARRAGIRFRRTPEAPVEFVHTINGSGLAVGRTFAAILENYQQANGSVNIPDALQPYMGGLTTMERQQF
jgi:seryl-tRNA synthetase